MKFKDYYSILSLSESASAQEIKRAYRKKAREFHPDVSKDANAEEKFKEIGEAYEALRDPARRAEYDNLRRHGYRHGDDVNTRDNPGYRRGQSRSRNYSGGFPPGGGGDFSDFFSTLFGSAGGFNDAGFGADGSARAGGAPFGPDFRTSVHTPGKVLQMRAVIPLEIAFSGGHHNLVVPAGDAQSQRELRIRIPAGTSSGKQLRLRRQGRPGRGGGAAGDLLVTVDIREHPLFSVSGQDVTLPVPLTPAEATTGCSITVPTLAGAVSVSVPASTNSGARLRLRGRGLPATAARSKGDQYLEFRITLPANPSAKAKALLQELEEEYDEHPRETFFANKAEKST